MNDEKSSLGHVFWLTAPFVYISGVIVGSLLWFFLGKIGVSRLAMSAGYHIPLSVSAVLASVLLWKASERNTVVAYKWLGRIAAFLYFATIAYSFTNIVKYI